MNINRKQRIMIKLAASTKEANIIEKGRTLLGKARKFFRPKSESAYIKSLRSGTGRFKPEDATEIAAVRKWTASQKAKGTLSPKDAGWAP